MIQEWNRVYATDFYINLLRQLPGLIVVMDKESKFIYSNKYTAEMFGYKNEDAMLGVNAFGMRCPAAECAADFIAQDQLVIESGKELTMLDIHEYANHEARILLTKKSPYEEKDAIAGAICHCTEMHSSVLSKICGVLIKSDSYYHSSKQGKERSYMVGATMSKKELSQRELDCVFYFLRGHTMKMTAKALRISPRTVETHLEQIRMKLGCTNKSEIIDCCLSEGLLNYIPRHILTQNISSIIHIAE